MDINNIILTGPMLTTLFKDHLIQEAQETASADTVQPVEFSALKYLGKNQRQILVLVKNPGAVYLPDEQLNFLTNILSACKLTLADTAIVNVAQRPVTQEELKKELNPTVTLLFNISPSEIDLPVEFPAFQVQSFGGCRYLLAPSLSEIELEKSLKLQLWNCLQRLFLA